MNTNNEQYEYMMKYRDQLCNFYSQYYYDWFVTLNLQNYNVEDSEKYLKIWRCNLTKKDHIQISYVGVIVLSKFTGSHIHLLVFGRNKDSETLLDRDERTWEKEWSRITHCDSFIEPVNDNGVVEYITRITNTPTDHFELIRPYNKDLLDKLKIIH